MTKSNKRKHKTRPSALCHYTRTMSNGPGQCRDQNVWCTFSFYWRHVISGTVMDKDILASNIGIEWNPACMATYIFSFFQWHEFLILSEAAELDRTITEINASLVCSEPSCTEGASFLNHTPGNKILSTIMILNTIGRPQQQQQQWKEMEKKDLTCFQHQRQCPFWAAEGTVCTHLNTTTNVSVYNDFCSCFYG